MTKHIKYPKTVSFKDFVHTARKGTYGTDKFLVTGTVKVHGTNASVVYNPSTDELYPQSRNNVIGVGSDNQGFAMFVEQHRQTFLDYLKPLAVDKPVVLYGEWAGKGIGKGTAINKLNHRVLITFDIFERDGMDDDGAPILRRIDVPRLHVPDLNIYDVSAFDLYGEQTAFWVDVNSVDLQEVIDRLNRLVLSVEAQCPVAAFFGVEGNGEGIVFSTRLGEGKIKRFKVVSSKFSSHKTEPKMPVTIDPVEKKAIDELVSYLLTDARYAQGVQEVGFYTMKQFGDLIKWVTRDILDEEQEAIVASGFEWKQIAKAITRDLKRRSETPW